MFIVHGGFFFVGFFLITGKGDVGACFEELFPELLLLVLRALDSGRQIVITHLGSLPDVARILGILLYQRQDTCRNYTMGLTEVMVDFCACQSLAILLTV